MKKVILVAAVSMLALASCKKDYTCDCTVSSQDVSIPYTGFKKADATDGCDAVEASYKTDDADATCTLK